MLIAVSLVDKSTDFERATNQRKDVEDEEILRYTWGG